MIENTAYACARGDFQKDCITRMLGEGQTCSLMELTGRAKQYSGQYRNSLAQLIIRLRMAGVTVERRASGPRGGERWHIVG